MQAVLAPAPPTPTGAATESGALAVDAGRPGVPGQVDAFTQALAALLGLPMGAFAQPAQTTDAAPAGAAQTQGFAVVRSGAGLVGLGSASPLAGAMGPTGIDLTTPPAGATAPSNGDAAALGQDLASAGPAAQLDALLAQLRLGPAPAPAANAAATAAQAEPAPQTAPNVGGQAPLADPSLLSISLIGRLQAPTDAASAETATGQAGPASPLAPLAGGAGSVALMLQPPTEAPAKPQPSSAVSKTAGHDDGAVGAEPASGSPSQPAIQAIGDAPNTGGDPAQSDGGHTGNGAAEATGGAQAPANAAAANANTPPVLAAPLLSTPQIVTGPAVATAPVAAQLATQVVKAVEGKAARFDIALEPAGLGRVDVRLQIDAAGQISAQFSFDSAHAAAEAKAQSGQLQQALEQAGFSVGQGGLSFDVGGQGASLARQQSAPPAEPSFNGPIALAESAAAPAQTPIRRAASGLDIII